MIVAGLVILLLVMPLQADAEHLFEAGVRAGIAGYNAQCTYVEPLTGWQAGILLSYTYHSPYVIGLRIAATFNRHQAGFYKSGYTDSYTTIDVEIDRMQIDYTIGSLREVHSAWSVGIPLQMAFSWGRWNLYLGPEIVLPLQSRWTETANNAALSVYYPKQDNRVYESYPLAAARSFSETQNGIGTKKQQQWWLSAEFCYDLPIYTSAGHHSYISIGVYADYSLARETEEPSDRISLLMLSDTREGFPLHRIMTPIVSALRQDKRLVTSNNLFDIGIKITFRLAPYNHLKRNAKTCHCYGITYY